MRMTIGMLGKHHKGEIKEISRSESQTLPSILEAGCVLGCSSAAKNKDAVSPSKNKRPGLGQTIASGVKATGKLVLLARGLFLWIRCSRLTRLRCVVVQPMRRRR
jgi:hypothetical protein